MVFNIDDYNENLDYCEYVYSKNKDFNLGLESPEDIQIVSNMYVDELIETNDGYIGDNFIQNDLILFEVIDKYLNSINNYKHNPEDINYTSKSNLDLSQHERIKSSRGGYSFNESFDDFGLDELDLGDSMKL